MATPNREEVWPVDLGLVAKIRPCLILSVALAAQDRILATVVPHTTSVRGTRFEVDVPVRFLKSGAFDMQNIITIPHAKLIRRLGVLTTAQMTLVESAVRAWLGL